MSVSVDRLKRIFSKTVLDSESQTTVGPSDSMVEEMLPSQPAALGGTASTQADTPAAGAAAGTGMVALPLLGLRQPSEHRRVLMVALVASLLAVVLLGAYALFSSTRAGQQLAAAGQAVLQSQWLAKAATQASVGEQAAFAELTQRAQLLTRNVQGLQDGNDAVPALGGAYADTMGRITPVVTRVDQSVKTILGQQKILTEIGDALARINKRSQQLQNISDSILAVKVEQGASPYEISAAGRLSTLALRLGKSATEMRSSDDVSANLVFQMGKDMNTFDELLQGLTQGSAELRLAPARDGGVRQNLEALRAAFNQTRTEVAGVLDGLKGFTDARTAITVVVADSAPLGRDLESLQSELAQRAGIGYGVVLLIALAVALAVASSVALAMLEMREGRSRQAIVEEQVHDAERLRQDAERLQLDAKRINDANQAAILRLMNELQMVAEGDLTQQATVTEDITGAIADSVNYTVEELRTLVASVQNTASRVAETTADVDSTSTELLAASNEQMNEIQATGKSVLDMAVRINQVSDQAQQSADVARQSLKAAESGLQAVHNAIGGMNAIRDQIQETSKRIKRLGESSQEIGEITELISDITDQTNVLALNAAIQAASAGEAGRGFSVVAEEVQRLAERSADATRQISALVRAIQTDTQDAVAAMERSTQGVVEGAKLSDNAGTRLAEIDQVSRRLSELILQISDAASREARLANNVADSIQNIFAVTEQTSDGTRTTAGQVRELSRMAEELRQSVARFKIA